MSVCRDLCIACKNAIQESDQYWRCGVLGSSALLGHQPTHCLLYSGTERPVDVAVIVATDAELIAVKKYLLADLEAGWSRLAVVDDGEWDHGFLPIEGAGARVSVVVRKARTMGMTAAATITSQAVHSFRPRLVAMPGICAGRFGETEIGDIVVPDYLFDWGMGRWEDDGSRMIFQRRPRQVKFENAVQDVLEALVLDRDLSSKILKSYTDLGHKVPEKSRCSVVNAPAASGAGIVDSKHLWTEVISDKKVLAVDMEAYAVGFATAQLATTRYRPDWVTCKAVCDFGFEKTKEHQEFAAFSSVSFLREFLSKYFLSDIKGRRVKMSTLI
jgi:nucleoside phosphorylase